MFLLRFVFVSICFCVRICICICLLLRIDSQDPHSGQLKGALEEETVEGEVKRLRALGVRDPGGCDQEGGGQLIGKPRLCQDVKL